MVRSTRSWVALPKLQVLQLRLQSSLLWMQGGTATCGADTPPQGTGRKPLPSSITKPWEGLQQQLNGEKDPEVRALLQQAADLKKKQGNTQLSPRIGSAAVGFLAKRPSCPTPCRAVGSPSTRRNYTPS
eukprot:4836394-Amphidinium_carterae.1